MKLQTASWKYRHKMLSVRILHFHVFNSPLLLTEERVSKMMGLCDNLEPDLSKRAQHCWLALLLHCQHSSCWEVTQLMEEADTVDVDFVALTETVLSVNHRMPSYQFQVYDLYFTAISRIHNFLSVKKLLWYPTYGDTNDLTYEKRLPLLTTFLNHWIDFCQGAVRL